MRAALGACALVSLVACRTASARPDVAAVVAEPGAESRAELGGGAGADHHWIRAVDESVVDVAAEDGLGSAAAGGREQRAGPAQGPPWPVLAATP